MKRRNFLRYGLTALSAPLFIQGQAMGIIAENPALKALTANNKTRKLVLIQLNGGNDGLNMFTPLDQYINLRKARPNIVIPETKLLRLTDVIGLHPSMGSFKRLYDQQEALIIQNVGNSTPSLSHFRSSDLLTSGSTEENRQASGWFGRYLEDLYPDYPNDFPNTDTPHPLAITFGPNTSPITQGTSNNYSFVFGEPTNNSLASSSAERTFPSNPYGHELKFISEAMRISQAYTDPVTNAANQAENLSNLYPETGKNELAEQLAMVARLIAGGLETQIYILNLNGFDTHTNQVESQETPEKGTHANLLKKLADAIRAFQNDLSLLGKDEEVIGLAVTEFGRRIASNKGLGTDHGEAYPAILFGKQINPTVIGHNPSIPDEVDRNLSLEVEVDIRSVYASIYQEWFEVEKDTVENILFGNFTTLPILKSSQESSFFREYPVKATVFPVPTSDYLNIQVDNKNPHLEITLFNKLGQKVRTFMDREVEGNFQEFQYSVRNFPPGHYVLRIRSKEDFVSKKVIITD